MLNNLVKKYLQKTFDKIHASGDRTKIVMELPNGKVYKNFTTQTDTADVWLRFNKWVALLKVVFLSGEGFATAYMKGELDVTGKNLPVYTLKKAFVKTRKFHSHSWWHFFCNFLAENYLRYFHINNKTYKIAARNARFHYNKPYEFFRLWIGEIGYTENYHHTGLEEMDEAQVAKFEHIAKKLNLKPGMHVVEVGSGFGYLACLMAKKYGCYVTNYGLVPEQNKVMEMNIKKWGVEDRVKIVMKDHRELLKEVGKYDRYVSVGVIEHAGHGFQEDWFRSMSVCLKEGGVGFFSALGHNHENVNGFFVNRNVWPGTDCIPLNKAVYWMEKYRLNIVDLENMWYHYQRALRDWAINFDKNWDKIKAVDPHKFTESFMRIWQMYLEGCIEIFEEEDWNANCWHVTFTKGKHKDYYPLTRDFIYEK